MLVNILAYRWDKFAPLFKGRHYRRFLGRACGAIYSAGTALYLANT